MTTQVLVGNVILQSLPSPGQIAYSNEEYSDQFFEFIQLAENPEFLSILCTHVLDIDVLNFDHLSRLRSLNLQCIRISDTLLLSISLIA